MTDIKEEFIAAIITREGGDKSDGGYTNDPSDSGGETKFGIIESVARSRGYTGRMIDMSRSFAEMVYRKEYWDSISGDELLALSEPVLEEMADTGVNMGTGRAIGFLQRSLNVLNKRGKLYDDIRVDFGMGPKTLSALNSYLKSNREDGVLVKMLDSLQGAEYVMLCEQREKDERFVYGWFKNRIGKLS